MGQIIAMPRKERVEGPNLVYVYGETILANAVREMKDYDDQPIEPKEFYEVTPQGIRKI